MDTLMRYFESVKQLKGARELKYPLPSSPETFSFP